MSNLSNEVVREPSALFTAHFAATPVFDSSTVAVPMTDAQIQSLRKSLFTEKRVNVTPNRFNTKVPYQVSTKWVDRDTKETTWTNYGRFSDLNAASYVGSIAGIAVYGAKALRGSFDEAKAVVHPEVIAWLADPRNQDTLLKAQTAIDGTVGF